MPISGCHDLPLATFNLPSRNNLQNKPNSAATMSLPCSRFATAQPQRRWEAPPGGGASGGFFQPGNKFDSRAGKIVNCTNCQKTRQSPHDTTRIHQKGGADAHHPVSGNDAPVDGAIQQQRRGGGLPLHHYWGLHPLHMRQQQQRHCRAGTGNHHNPFVHIHPRRRDCHAGIHLSPGRQQSYIQGIQLLPADPGRRSRLFSPASPLRAFPV